MMAITDELLVAGDLLPEQEQLTRQLGEDVFESYCNGEITQLQLLQIGLTWKGFTGPGGWQDVAKGLEPSVRGPLAYGLGLRFLRKNNREEAIKFFETAKGDAPKDSSLARLATAELDQFLDR
jgi:hypothetical protein